MGRHLTKQAQKLVDDFGHGKKLGPRTEGVVVQLILALAQENEDLQARVRALEGDY